ncbi:hypothetical protein JCM8547_006559 [Rhodosporidiobolus lusitaniae]
MLSFDPRDLFPPAQSTSQSSLAVPASSVALLGPLPISSLLHISLNHLRGEEMPKSPVSPMRERSKGKQRASDDDEKKEQDLPPRPARKLKERRVLILTPDRDVLRDELSKEGDVSLLGARRSGETARLLDSVDIRHLPSSAHLTYFLTTCYTYFSPSSSDAYSAYLATKPLSKLDPSYLPYDPTMVILHAPSDYLEEEGNQGAGIEAYASLLALFCLTFSQLCASPPFLVLYDSLASRFSLSILPLHLSSGKRKPKKRSFEASEAGEGGEQSAEEDDVDRVQLRRIAERFFDWVGEAHEVSREQSALGAPSITTYVLFLSATAQTVALLPAHEKRKVEVEYVASEVDVEDESETEEGGMRVEVVM